MRSAGQLIVDRVLHAAEIARFHSHVVCGQRFGLQHLDGGRAVPMATAVSISRATVWVSVCVRIATRWRSQAEVWQRACWVCTNATTRCARKSRQRDVQQHVVSGSQGDNMERMARMRRGGGRHAVWHFDSRGVRRERSVTLRDAVRHGWDAAAVQAALLGDQPTLW